MKISSFSFLTADLGFHSETLLIPCFQMLFELIALDDYSLLQRPFSITDLGICEEVNSFAPLSILGANFFQI